ncbi:hypothetical protein [Cohaesibacter gelatinilyticus]|uniref:Uncharacterized protein n=1 Tax=Cohaesibacter gelatinilyticus TaxID=372072 RepID=A0A285NFU7_9HYPH|nr:hypothetical protein [Cohaesibacter gelatinilyticus]SNZ08384.1 hypothetical protein SAMN06265368_1635 [Cohaesibacter gelatinilyticus]
MTPKPKYSGRVPSVLAFERIALFAIRDSDASLTGLTDLAVYVNNITVEPGLGNICNQAMVWHSVVCATLKRKKAIGSEYEQYAGRASDRYRG